MCAHRTFSAFRFSVRSLSPVHLWMFTVKGSFARVPQPCVVRCRRVREAAAGESLHHWKLEFSQFRFNLYLLRGFLRAGLAALHITSLHA
jgi:hypothetical protein